MKYDWEKKRCISKAMAAARQALLGTGFTLEGIAVSNNQTCEGALITRKNFTDDADIDAVSDIRGDAMVLWDQAHASFYGAFQK